jgi:hypothetical protein
MVNVKKELSDNLGTALSVALVAMMILHFDYDLPASLDKYLAKLNDLTGV